MISPYDDAFRGGLAIVRTPIVVIALLLAGGCTSPLQPEINSKALLELARKTKAEGKRSVSIGIKEPLIMGPGSFRGLLSANTSLAIAVPTGSPRVVVHSDTIVTAQDLRVARWLLRVAPRPRACRQPWPEVANDEGLMTMYLAKGTVIVDGVRITHTSQSEVDLVAGQRYLVLVQDCPGRRLEPAYWSYGFALVTEDGVITPARFNEPPAPFMKEIIDFGTVTALEEVIPSVS
jgi:hypothetical protein